MSAADVDLEQPTFWTVEGPSYVFRVSEVTALHIKCELLNAIVEFIQFPDICGSPCLYRREQIVGMWRSTPESRAMDRALNRAVAAEIPPGTDGS